MVSNKWRQLSETERQHYDEKAKKINEDNYLKSAEEKKMSEHMDLGSWARSEAKKQVSKPKIVTPFIAFSSEVRKKVINDNKGLGFGAISKIIGKQWRQLSENDKQHYEEKAKNMNMLENGPTKQCEIETDKS